MTESRWLLEREGNSIQQARDAVREYIHRTDPGADSSVAVLVVGDIVSNALIHPRWGQDNIELVIDVVGDRIHIEVQDVEPRSEAPREDQRLPLVECFSAVWGRTSLPGDRERVWCELTRREGASPSE